MKRSTVASAIVSPVAAVSGTGAPEGISSTSSIPERRLRKAQVRNSGLCFLNSPDSMAEEMTRCIGAYRERRGQLGPVPLVHEVADVAQLGHGVLSGALGHQPPGDGS